MSPEFVLGYRAMMLDGIMREAETTKKVMAAVPDASFQLQVPIRTRAPPRNWPGIIANTDVQFLEGIADLKFNMETRSSKPQTSAEVAAWYDENMKRGVARVAALTAGAIDDARRPSSACSICRRYVSGFLNNHSIHHRGELATYLRPMGSKVPSIYGGSYDEPFVPPVPAEAAA